MPVSSVDLPVNIVAVMRDLDWSVNILDLLTYRRDSLANSLDYSANSSISIRAMLIDNLDSMVSMLVKRLAIDMRTATWMDCSASPVSPYVWATIPVTIQMRQMHLTVRSLDRRESYRLL